MVIRMRATRAHRDNRRSHHALSAQNPAKCPDCGAGRRNHSVCRVCGKYNGRLVIDLAKRTAKREAKKKKERAGKK